jgi:hypothetical protein
MRSSTDNATRTLVRLSKLLGCALRDLWLHMGRPVHLAAAPASGTRVAGYGHDGYTVSAPVRGGRGRRDRWRMVGLASRAREPGMGVSGRPGSSRWVCTGSSPRFSPTRTSGESWLPTVVCSSQDSWPGGRPWTGSGRTGTTSPEPDLPGRSSGDHVLAALHLTCHREAPCQTWTRSRSYVGSSTR